MAAHRLFCALILMLVFAVVSTIKGTQLSTVNNAQGCSRIHITAPDGARFLTSPNYPSTYPKGADLCWVVDTKRINPGPHPVLGYHLHVIPEDFHLHTSNDSSKTTLEFRDGPTENGTLLAQWCPKMPPQGPLLSTSDVLYIRFRSGEDARMMSHGYGFQLRVQALAEPPLDVLTDSGCKQLRIESSDMTYVMTSPNYPNNYGNNHDLCYIINLKLAQEVKGLGRILFEIYDCHLESSKGCIHDYVEVLDIGSMGEKTIARWCGEGRHIAVTSTGTSLCVRFKSDDSETHRGFHATFHADGESDRDNTVRRQKRATRTSRTYRTYRSASTYRTYRASSSYYTTYHRTTYTYTYGGVIAGEVIGAIVFIGLVIGGIVLCIKLCHKPTRITHISIQPQNNGQAMHQSMGQPQSPRTNAFGAPSYGNVPSNAPAPPPFTGKRQFHNNFQGNQSVYPATAAPY